MFSSIDEGVLILDIKGKIIKVNKVFEEMFGLNKKEVVNKTIEEAFPDNIISIFNTDKKGLPHTFKLNDRWYEIRNIHIYKKNTTIGEAFFIKDITLRVETENKLIEAKNKTERESQAKSIFLANMAHEIRTPLNGILGMIELFNSTPLSPLQKHYLDMLSSSAGGLYNLINDILDMSKIEAGKIEIEREEVDLKTLLYNVLNTIYLKGFKKGLELLLYIEPDVPRYIIGDFIRISQILLNLLGNAVKFTEKGYISLKVLKEEENKKYVTLKFIVKDTGIGIPEEKIPILFDKFVQADTSTTRRFGGTGLGLSITKELIQLMKGEIGVESKVGIGTTFTFTIKAGISPRSEKIGDETLHKIENLRLLIISENRAMCEFLTNTTGLWGIKSRSIGEIKNLKVIDPRNYNLILFDIHDYKKDRRRIKELKEDKIFKEIPIFVLASINILEEVLRDKYIDDYIIKPVKQSDLYNKLNEIEKNKTIKFLKEKNYKEEKEFSKTENNTIYRILMVEDNEINQTVLKRFLELSKWKIDIDIAENGEKALEKIREKEFDLVLMDINMPIMGGIEATQRIREIEKGKEKHLPIIALTAAAFEEDKKRFLASGMDDYLPKPFKKEDLYEKIEKFFLKIENTEITKRKVLDITNISRELEDDELLRSLMEASLKMLEKEMKDIKNAIKERDHDTLKKVTHKLKGGVSKFSTILFNILNEIEESAKNADYEKTEKLFITLIKNTEIFKKEMAEFIDSQLKKEGE